MSFNWKKFDKAKALEVTLHTALKVLETTENVLNTTPIPGAAAAIGVILEVVKRQERASSNTKRTVEQQERLKKLVSQMMNCETDPKGILPDALSELRNASKELARQLQEYARALEEETTHQIRPRWMTCTEDEEALQEFLRKCNEAIADYQYVQGDRIEKCVTEIRERMESLERNRLIGTLPRVESAPYNADRSAGTLTSCSEGTREPLLEDIANWISDPNAHKIYWLRERAGFGKTAVARSVAEQAAKDRTLAASFFFSYQIADLNHASHVITTIIYQLSFVGGALYKQALAEAIESHPNALRAQLKDQVQPLFLDPLKNFNLASPNSPVVIILDALDECQPEGAQHLIGTFIAAVLSLNLPLKLFVTSRPEPHLIAAFSDLGVKSRVIVDTSNEDIETYLRAELAQIPSKPGIRDLNLPREWITEDDIQALLERAGAKSVTSDPSSTEKGLFVYIATVIRFIGDTRRCDPQKHLRIVLSATLQLVAYRPFQVLDDLYTRVLDVALEGAEDLLQRFQAVVGGRMAVNPALMDDPSIATLEMLLSLPQGEIRRTIINLQSVIQSPDTDSTLPSFHHRSFTDFLTSKDRSGPRYYIDIKVHVKCLASGCRRVIASSGLKEEVTNAMSREDYFIYPTTAFPPEFKYASFCLPYYYESIGGDQSLLEDLEKFIREDFGWWIELVPQITNWNLYTISDTADPQDVRDLPVLCRALASSSGFNYVDMIFHLHALVRNELRRYISVVVQQEDGEPRMETRVMITSIKNYIHELRQKVDLTGQLGMGRDLEATSAAIVTFAKEAQAAIDIYQLSVGNQEEVEGSRKRTIFIRRQVKRLLVQPHYVRLGITADQLEHFEEEGVWATKPTPMSD